MRSETVVTSWRKHNKDVLACFYCLHTNLNLWLSLLMRRKTNINSAEPLPKCNVMTVINFSFLFDGPLQRRRQLMVKSGLQSEISDRVTKGALMGEAVLQRSATRKATILHGESTLHDGLRLSSSYFRILAKVFTWRCRDCAPMQPLASNFWSFDNPKGLRSRPALCRSLMQSTVNFETETPFFRLISLVGRRLNESTTGYRQSIIWTTFELGHGLFNLIDLKRVMFAVKWQFSMLSYGVLTHMHGANIAHRWQMLKGISRFDLSISY